MLTRLSRLARVTGVGGRARVSGLTVFRGVRPVRRSRLTPELLAGLTLAALGVPEVLGYARIAGMPVVTGLYTMLLPAVVFAVFGASRHLVVGADSATAAILAAGLTSLAVPGSPRYLDLAALAALITGVLLLLARLVRLGFLANFLSRTVLIGFLTGVGFQVAIGQLGDMFGLPASGRGTIDAVRGVARHLETVSRASLVASLVVIAAMLGMRRLAPRLPGALLAVVGSIVVTRIARLPEHGVAVLGAVPGGLPHLGLPALHSADVIALLGTSASMAVVVLAQSSATARAYSSKYDETPDENTDLVGLGLANLAAAATGTFVVNGSPTKTQMVDSAGGRTQLSQLTTSAVVLAVLLVLTRPLADLPRAVLAAVVFLIGLELVDVAGMRRLYRVRRDEFIVAALTALAVVVLGVEQGIVLAFAASIVDHLRHSYAPSNRLLAPAGAGRWRSLPVVPGGRSIDGLVVYRFGSSLYYANARQLLSDVSMVTGSGPPPTWFCLDGVVVEDVDYTAGAMLVALHARLRRAGVRMVLCEIHDAVRTQLDAYGLSALVGADAYFPTPADVQAAWEGRPSAPGQRGPSAGAG